MLDSGYFIPTPTKVSTMAPLTMKKDLQPLQPPMSPPDLARTTSIGSPYCKKVDLHCLTLINKLDEVDYKVEQIILVWILQV